MCTHMNCSPSSLKGYRGDYIIGSTLGLTKGDTRSLGYSPNRIVANKLKNSFCHLLGPATDMIERGLLWAVKTFPCQFGVLRGDAMRTL